MPPAIVSANIGGVLAAMQQAQLQKANLQQALSPQDQMQVAQMQSMAQRADLQQALGQFNSLANAAAPPRTGPNPYLIGRAKSYADEGEKIIERMAFWAGVLGPLSQPIVDRMVMRLERVIDEVENFVRMAA